MEHSAEIAVSKWSVPECAFEIEYSPRVLDDIRLAVVDAFFSLPRGGAEIGGILLGKWEEGHVSITGFQPLDCEHALGPSFTLSPRDQTQMAELIAAARRNGPDRQPVGWYHSHTRSEIFLSDADLAIHNRYFPEPWQVALVLKPHTFEPTRGGFFFRDSTGSIKSEASCQEFRLEAMPLRPGGTPSAGGLRPRKQARQDPAVTGSLFEIPPATDDIPPPPIVMREPAKPKGRVPITREIQVDPPVRETRPEAPPAYPTPNFGQSSPQRPWRPFKVALILAIGVAIGGAGYETRESWLPWTLAKARAVLPHEPDPYLALAVGDDNGQLKIQWDRNAPAVRNALDGTLEIVDGNSLPQSLRLDGAHLATGTIIYARQAERVDVTLMVTEPAGQMIKEQTSFLGRLPAQKPPAADDSQAAKDRDAEAQRADKLQKDLTIQAAKTRRLEKDLKNMREQLEKSKHPPAAPLKND